MFVIKSFATPLVWVLSLLLVGLVLMRFVRRQTLLRIGRALIFSGTLVLLVLSFPPFANVLTYSLESRAPVPTADVLSTLDVVVVLGGGGYPSGGLREEAELAQQSYPRLYHGVRVFRKGNPRILAFCGGRIGQSQESESEIMKEMAIQLGVPGERILTETASTNTMQNAVGLARLLPGDRGRCIGLVTSATHMLRSARTFRAIFPDDTIVPIPVHHRFDANPWRIENLRPSVHALEASTAALHEWIGLIWYAVRY